MADCSSKTNEPSGFVAREEVFDRQEPLSSQGFTFMEMLN